VASTAGLRELSLTATVSPPRSASNHEPPYEAPAARRAARSTVRAAVSALSRVVASALVRPRSCCMAVIRAADAGARVVGLVAAGVSAADAWVPRPAATVLSSRAADKPARRSVVRLKGVPFRRSGMGEWSGRAL
jgi:hypothetical protein